jgi:sugar phosphate isomerase/epimerase
MKFGMPTLMELTGVEETVSLCAQLGLSFVELNTNFPMHQPHLLDADRLRELAKKHGIFYTIHLNDEMAVAEFNPWVSNGYRQMVLEVIDFAKKIGVKTLNMHMSDGGKYTMPDKVVRFYDAYRDAYLREMTVFRDMCEKAIGDSGIRICMENTGGFRDYHLAALEILLESPVFALNMDVGHNYCAGGVDEGFLLAHKERLCHMHLHDAKAPTNDHLALGEGELDLPKFLSLAEELNCTVVLEVKTVAGLRNSVQWMKMAGYMG